MNAGWFQIRVTKSNGHFNTGWDLDAAAGGVPDGEPLLALRRILRWRGRHRRILLLFLHDEGGPLPGLGPGELQQLRGAADAAKDQAHATKVYVQAVSPACC